MSIFKILIKNLSIFLHNIVCIEQKIYFYLIIKKRGHRQFIHIPYKI